MSFEFVSPNLRLMWFDVSAPFVQVVSTVTAYIQFFLSSETRHRAAASREKRRTTHNADAVPPELPIEMPSIHPEVEFHFILSFAIDYTGSSATNGKFRIFWDEQNLSPSSVSSIKAQHSNVKFALSLGGDTAGKDFAYFKPKSITSWVENAFKSISGIVKEYDLDGVDIDYEHFKADSDTFTECIGQLLLRLKRQNVISFASIAPFEDNTVQSRYLALWRKYGHLIDYVNFQFYSYGKGTTVSQFLNHFETQSSNYEGGKVLASFATDGSGGLTPENGFFKACITLQSRGKLHGIFVWSADDSRKNNFHNEIQAQNLLANED